MELAKLFKPIELTCIDSGWKNISINESNEELVSLITLANGKILYAAEYYKKEIPGSVNECFVRKSVAELLIQATDYLPRGCSFLIYDAWRPFKVQDCLFQNYINQLKKNYPAKNESDIMELAQKYVSIPSIDVDKPSPHFTGGAVDLTIVDENGEKLNMETAFDSFSQEAGTRYYEEKLERENKLTIGEINYCMNRRLLYNIMTSVGFTNYPNEWWHFDYGNQFWGYIKKQTAIYGLAAI